MAKSYRKQKKQKRKIYEERLNIARKDRKKYTFNELEKEYEEKGYGFDFYKLYTLHGERIYFAYRDFSGELSFADILEMFADMSVGELLDKLRYIVNLEPQYSKEAGTDSNGRGGDAKVTCDIQSNLIFDYAEIRNINRRKPKRIRKNTGNFKGYQILKNGRRNSYTEVRPVKLLQIANAIMFNVTEWDRVTFYESFYNIMAEHIPEFAKLLPPKRDWSM